MTAQLFSSIGYLSVALWLLVPVLLVLHHLKRPRRWLCHLALVVAVAAFVCAKVNSETYVNEIQLDRTDEIAAAEALKEKARQAALEAREGEVANVRFAEDSFSDRLDEGGMDDADRKYIETLTGDGEPGWKQNKKQRSGEKQQDDSLEGMLDTEAPDEGVKSKFTEEAEEKEPIVMSEENKAMADRLDGANLKITRLLIVLTIILLLIDYLKRANVYGEAYLPLPLPSSWLNSATPAPPVTVRPNPPRRDLPAELAWLTRRGDAFVCLTTDGNAAAAIPDALPKLPCGMKPVDVLRVTDAISDDFVFEALWYGRSSFVVDSQARAEQMINRFVELMTERRATRAVVRQTAHVIWNVDAPIPETRQGEFAGLAKVTGLSVMMTE